MFLIGYFKLYKGFLKKKNLKEYFLTYYMIVYKIIYATKIT